MKKWSVRVACCAASLVWLVCAGCVSQPYGTPAEIPSYPELENVTFRRGPCYVLEALPAGNARLGAALRSEMERSGYRVVDSKRLMYRADLGATAIVQPLEWERTVCRDATETHYTWRLIVAVRRPGVWSGDGVKDVNLRFFQAFYRESVPHRVDRVAGESAAVAGVARNLFRVEAFRRALEPDR